jgi:D-lactate dehydrogenase
MYMKKIAFFDTKPYDKIYFDKLSPDYGFEIKYIESKLNEHSAVMAEGCDGVAAFVNDSIDKNTIIKLDSLGIHVLVMRSAGYNNVDFKTAFGKIHVLRVPAYSPYAVAEHAMALIFALNRKVHRAYNRTREYNFALSGLIGFDLHGKTIGVIGTGKIGRVFADICKGFGVISHMTHSLRRTAELSMFHWTNSVPALILSPFTALLARILTI